jgi:hypothetical protein
VVVLDNLSGVLKSSTMASLLTSPEWNDRPLGSTSWVRCNNDRLWVITGNNLNIAGDLPRRTLRVTIDPGMPNPESRTDFTIKDLEGWVKAHRGRLLAALLTLVRAWVVEGSPLGPEQSSDVYSLWVRTVAGILSVAGIPGTFDHVETRIQASDSDNDWRDFLAAVWEQMQDGPWTVKQILPSLPAESLPGELADRARMNGNVTVARSLGKWLSNREKQWAGHFTVKRAGHGADGRAVRWQISRYRNE